MPVLAQHVQAYVNFNHNIANSQFHNSRQSDRKTDATTSTRKHSLA
jgi:hypothetical protein